MIDIIKVESKRILNKRYFLILVGITFIYSLFSAFTAISHYHVRDSSGQIILQSWDNLRESKTHRFVLDEETIHQVVAGEKSSPYLYDRLLTLLVAANYDTAVEDLTPEEVSEFYDRRLERVKLNLSRMSKDEDAQVVEEKASWLVTPIELGYAEGWKNLNNRMIDIVTVIVLATPFVVIPLFAQDPKTKMQDLSMSTKFGKRKFVQAKIVAGFGVSSVIYVTSLSIYSLIQLMVFGFRGGNLPIQSSLNDFFSPYQLTFIQQYFLNIWIGWMALLLLVALTLLVSVLVKKVLSTAFVVLFLLLAMQLTPKSFELNYYIGNFFPYEMINFSAYYANPYVYRIFGNIIPLYFLVMIVALILVLVFVTATLILSLRNIKRPLK